ncbi:MAG TPA: aspartate aminotransferase family protein [Mycobacteriales bacterium]|nr:aspartate aminotransferase family protein [Mycobacteriales bacterium]
MGFDIRALIEARRGENAALHDDHLNAQVPRMLGTIGFDRVLTTAAGAWYDDADGNRYLDFLSGFGVFGIGRNHPVVRRALQDVLDADLADMVQFDLPLLPGLLAEQLLARSPGMERVYFCNSGSEAVEAALKFARCATGKPRILYADHAYHGLTTGALSVNGAEEFRRGFAPLLPDTKVPFGDLEAIEREVRRGDVAALLVEPIQGKGVQVAPAGYLAGAQQLLHASGGLLIADEVQTGLGRTGRFLAHHHDGVTPDIVTVAKTLSGGFVPVGATMARAGIFEKVYSSLDRVFVHASTFMGNALAMTAGLATLAVLDDEDLIANAEHRGQQLTDGLRAIAADSELIADIRGRGLMIGIEFGRPSSLAARGMWTMLNTARKGLFAQLVVVPLYNRHRVLTQVAGDHMAVIKLLPPLMIGDEEVETFLTAFADVMADAKRPNGLAVDFGRTLVKQALGR